METIDTADQDRLDMERLAAGHDAALNSLMERHAGPVYQFLFRMLQDEEDANDLAQETFVRVFRHRDRFGSGKFTTWLYTIASNLARTEYRRRGRHPNVSLESDSGGEGKTLSDLLPSKEPTPREEADESERRAMVRLAVDRLPLDQKEALVLCEWEEMSVVEAAAALNTTEKAVESRLFRARRRLKQELCRVLNSEF